MRTVYLLFLPAILSVTAQAQSLSLGVTGGVPVQTPLGQTNDRMPFAIGPTVNIRISSRFSIETGLLFHRMGESARASASQYPESAVSLVSTAQRVRVLEVPVLAKFHFRAERETWRPFVTLGPSIRRTSEDFGSSATILSGTNLTPLAPQPALNANRVSLTVDPSVGVGVDFKAGRFHLDPEVRYSYWGAGSTIPVRKNQVDFLLGFRF
jgi:hypothetical protein